MDIKREIIYKDVDDLIPYINNPRDNTNAVDSVASSIKNFGFNQPIVVDGKYIIDNDKLIICQSKADSKELNDKYKNAVINPLGDWSGGTDVDSGATNRKLGSDMGRAVTGGGLHGKDLSKADVSVNIYAHLKAQETGEEVELSCAIGDEFIDGKPYQDIVDTARGYIDAIGGFEKLAEWGLI